MNLPAAIQPALQGIVPSQIVTCAADGTPNVTVVSQVFPVDASHVAISNQFLSKSHRNLRENPRACIQVLHPADCSMWLIEARYERSETEGPLFESMAMQLEAIASMSGMEDVFKLHAADVFEVLTVRRLDEGIGD